MFYVIRIDDQSPFVNGRHVGSILFSHEDKFACVNFLFGLLEATGLVSGRYFVFDHAHVAPSEIHEDEFPQDGPVWVKQVETSPRSLVHFTDATVVADSFWHLKNRTLLASPWFNARVQFWYDREVLFPDEDDNGRFDTTYWNEPPILLLPEHAESLCFDEDIFYELSDLARSFIDTHSYSGDDYIEYSWRNDE